MAETNHPDRDATLAMPGSSAPLGYCPTNLSIDADPKKPDVQQYLYDDVNSSGREIRLLHLLPGEGSDRLVARLEHTIIGQHSEYEALSYAWGVPERPCRLFMSDNESIPITTRLHECLLRLRSKTFRRVLWIDAVCVNQNNFEERAEQVRLMRLVFFSAQRVLCWLGEDIDGEGAVAIGLLQKLGRTEFGSAKTGHAPEALLEANAFPDKDHKDWKALIKFYNRPWFKRYWVVQEFVLARTVHLMCGANKVDWRQLDIGNTRVLRFGLLHWSTKLNQPGPLLGPMRRLRPEAEIANAAFVRMTQIRRAWSPVDCSYRYLTGLIEGHSTYEHLETEFRKTRKPSLGFFLRKYRPLVGLPNLRERQAYWHELCRLGRADDRELQASQLPSWPIACLALYLRSQLTTDPRDKLYAILGLCIEGDDPSLRPSYTEPAASTFIRFARYIISNAATNNGLHVLLYAGTHSKPLEPALQLPSWVLDWSRQSEPGPPGFLGVEDICRFYHAAGDTRSKVNPDGHPSTLRITASFVDKVTEIVSFPDWGPWIDEHGDRVYMFTEGGQFNPDVLSKIALETARRGADLALDLQSLFAAADGLVQRPDLRSGPGESPQEVLWRTLCGNVAPTQPDFSCPDTSWNMQYSQFREWLSQLVPGQHDELTLMHQIRTSFGEWAIGFWSNLQKCYALCRTELGFIGMVPRCTALGDEVHIVLGACIPVVLSRETSQEETYELIGPCYIHGIMQGEFVDGPRWNEQEVSLV